jgi:hypothetical protein
MVGRWNAQSCFEYLTAWSYQIPLGSDFPNLSDVSLQRWPSSLAADHLPLPFFLSLPISSSIFSDMIFALSDSSAFVSHANH